MTIKEYALKKAEELKRAPFQRTVISIVNDICNLKVNNESISENQILTIVKYIGEEVGDIGVVNESFDNTQAISIMAAVHEILAKKGINVSLNGGKN